VVKHVAPLQTYGTIWLNEDVIANILLMSLAIKKFPVRYDSAAGDQFVVSKPDKDVIFAASISGRYYHDTTNRAVVMVNTIKENREDFKDRELDRAKSGRRALGLVEYPSPHDFKKHGRVQHD
jgi:hypothetical protein